MFSLFEKVSEEKARQISPVTLAFVGDAVYTLLVRSREVLSSDKKAGDLQVATAKCVSAKGQSELLERVESRFTPEEEAVYHRGRNAKKPTKSKNASVTDYVRSTGFEAVLGYLYLSGQYARIEEILKDE